jgi:hypothetical protein
MKFRGGENFNWVCSLSLIEFKQRIALLFWYTELNAYNYMLSVVSVLCKTGILIENMRREGFELSVSPPKVM